MISWFNINLLENEKHLQFVHFKAKVSKLTTDESLIKHILNNHNQYQKKTSGYKLQTISENSIELGVFIIPITQY